MEDLLQYFDFSEVDSVTAKLAGTDTVSFSDLFGLFIKGDFTGAYKLLMQELGQLFFPGITAFREILLAILGIGMVAMLLYYLAGFVKNKQVADMTAYFIYLLMGVILLQCFSGILGTAKEAIENIVLFVRLMVPTYLLAVGVASGPATVGAGYQLLLLLIYGTEKILLGVVLPLIYSYGLLTMINGIWVEEKLTLLTELLEKAVGWILKASLGVVTGISVFQSLITPVLDSVKTSAVEKALSALPGIGNAADGILELAVGSAVVVRNSIGVLLLLLLLAACAAPLLEILFTALLIKLAAAFMGIVSDKRVTNCTDHMGNAGVLLFRTAGTAMLLFMITLALLAIGSRGM